MGEDGEERSIESAEYALRHRPAIHAEARVDRPDHELEACEQLLVVVESPIGEDVGLDAFEDAKASTRQLIVDRVNVLELSQDLLSRESTGIEGGGRVIGDADVAPPTRPRPARHLANRALAVGIVCVAVKHAPDVVTLEQSGKRP